jgi:hypothetical protein
LVLLGLLLLSTAACGREIPQPAQPSPGNPTAAVTPTASTGSTDLSIVVTDGGGERQTWQLACGPAGGTHPDPEAACAALLANGALAMPAVRKDVACTDIYGGPEKATISGTFQGRRVLSSFSRVNGCEIGRWELLQGLLPPGGV